MPCPAIEITLPSDNQIEETLAVVAELSSQLLAKRRRSVDKDAAEGDTKNSHQHQGEKRPEPKKKRRKKSVHFSEEEYKVIVVEEQANSWYHEQDYQRIRQENLGTLIAIAQSNGKLGSIDANSHCMRGLEKQISIALLNVSPYVRRKTVVKKVLDLQKSGCSDANALREISRSVSMPDKLRAWRTATIDVVKN